MKNNHLIKKHWLDRAIEVYNFHIEQIKLDSRWTVRRTAEVLNRSIGSVSQDIQLADFSRAYEKQLRRLTSAKEGMEFVRSKKRELLLRELA